MRWPRLSRRKTPRALAILYGFFLVLLVLNIGFWHNAKSIRQEWGNVPPAPSALSLRLMTLGDAGAAYRATGFFLQNLGNVGGRYESLRGYNYDYLEDWFFAAMHLDENAAYVPFLAAYYYGALTTPEDFPELISPLVTYLGEAGNVSYGEQWRWLAHAVYLSQFVLKDHVRALTLATKLSEMDGNVAPWGRQLAAFINTQMGNKEAAAHIMTRILMSEGDLLDPNEVRYIREYICERTDPPPELAMSAFCLEM